MIYLENLFNQIIKIEIGKHVSALFIVVLALIINKFIICRIFNFLIDLSKKTENFIDDTIIKAIEKPVKLYVIFKGVYYALVIIEYEKLNIDKIPLFRIEKLVGFILIAFFFYNLTLEDSFLYKKIGRKDNKNVAFPFFAIIIRLIIIIFIISLVAKELGFSGLLAGLGVSGVAFALMAQDTFSNLFGGVLISLDRPFAIGDWIQTEKAEGIVEEITFRSTKVRTFAMALLTIPNSKLANDNIINWTQREFRRIHFKLTIKGITNIEKIEIAIKKIKSLIENTNKISDKLIIVSFNEISQYGYGIFIYFYTTEMEYVKYELLKQEINLEILKILKEEGIELMFISFNLNNENIKEVDNPNNEIDFASIESTLEIQEEELGK